MNSGQKHDTVTSAETVKANAWQTAITTLTDAKQASYPPQLVRLRVCPGQSQPVMIKMVRLFNRDVELIKIA